MGFFDKFKKKKYDTLLAYNSSFGGDMLGSYSATTVKVYDDTHAIIRNLKASWHGEEPKETNTYVDIEILDGILEVFKEYKYKNYAKLPLSKMKVLDAGTTTYRFEFEGGFEVKFSTNQLLPQKGFEGIDKINDIIAKYTNEEENSSKEID